MTPPTLEWIPFRPPEPGPAQDGLSLYLGPENRCHFGFSVGAENRVAPLVCTPLGGERILWKTAAGTLGVASAMARCELELHRSLSRIVPHDCGGKIMGIGGIVDEWAAGGHPPENFADDAAIIKSSLGSILSALEALRWTLARDDDDSRFFNSTSVSAMAQMLAPKMIPGVRVPLVPDSEDGCLAPPFQMLARIHAVCALARETIGSCRTSVMDLRMIGPEKNAQLQIVFASATGLPQRLRSILHAPSPAQNAIVGPILVSLAAWGASLEIGQPDSLSISLPVTPPRPCFEQDDARASCLAHCLARACSSQQSGPPHVFGPDIAPLLAAAEAALLLPPTTP